MWSPLTVTLVQSTIINAISNVLAQIIDQWKHDKPFKLNVIALIQFVTYAIIIVPINFSWQKYIEARYPGFPTAATTWKRWRWTSFNNRHVGPSSSGRVDDRPIVIPISADHNNTTTNDIPMMIKDKPAATAPHRWRSSRNSSSSSTSSGMRNFLMKFFLDQTVGSVMNILLFIVLINLLKGASWSVVWEAIGKDFYPIMIARLKYRPVVSTLMYTVVPVDRRVVFGSACGVIWGIYLSLYAAV
ncbi:hypothetical protein VTN77DRAFT_5512 [Rasamsonia byssochlamydoides]|uniref:uncharacterized protein n=1 Tax=Rasamsonia byssochlamydoides TaxID=89139 RepID=UPI003743F4F8